MLPAIHDVVHFRHPNDLGGVGWLFSLAILNVSLPLAILVYESEGGANEVVVAAWAFCKIALPCTIIVFLIFFFSIKKEYRGTFYSAERGKDLAMRRFLHSSDDSVKADAIFPNTRKYWKEIEGEVEKWVKDNWKRWMDEEPEWFDDIVKSQIPPHMIPSVQDRKKVEELQSERRRSSLLGSIGVQHRRRYSSSINVGVNKVLPDK